MRRLLTKRRWIELESGAFVPIYDTVLAADTANFDVQNISPNYKNLKLLLTARSTRAASTFDTLGMTFNADTGANYDSQGMNAQATNTPTAAETIAGANFVRFSQIPAVSSPAGVAAQVVCDIYDYAGTTFHKAFTALTSGKLDSATGQVRIWVSAGSWRSTAAINRFTITPANGSFLAGCRLTVYAQA